MTIPLVDTISFIIDIAMFITVPIYIMVILTIFKYRKDTTLKHSFFALIVSVGIADIGRILTIFFGNKVAGYGWIPEFYIFLGALAGRLNAIFGFFFSAAQTIGCFIIAINRFTAYVFPLRHHKIWQGGKVIGVLIIFKWFIALANISLFFSYYQYQITVLPNNKTVLLQWAHGYDAVNINIYNQLIGKGSLIGISMFIYFTIFAVALHRQLSIGAQSQKERTVLQASAVGFIHCIGLVIYLLACIIVIIPGLEGCGYPGALPYCVDDSVYKLISSFGSDCFSAVNPYALLYFSSAVRTRFCEMYGKYFCFSCSPSLSSNTGIISVVPVPKRSTNTS